MNLPRLTFPMLLALVLAPLAVAQNLPAPEITLSAAPLTCPDSQPGYTCNATVSVTWAIPQIIQDGCQSGCHFEYCLTQPPYGEQPSCQNEWSHQGPETTFTLTWGNMENKVWAAYATVVSGGGTTVSDFASATINLNSSAPVAYMNSPAGILNPLNQQFALQSQYINSDVPQWITYSGWSNADPTETVTFNIFGCPSCSSNLLAGPLGGSTSMWEWPSSASPPAYSYVQVSATDQAGNVFTNPLPQGYTGTTPILSLFSPNNNEQQEVDCYASGTSTGRLLNPVQCTTLADGIVDNEDIPGDPQSVNAQPEYLSCAGDQLAFSGYADPSMRRDPIVSSSNPYATNLWMLYSYPEYWAVQAQQGCKPPGDPNPVNYTGVVEIHLAESVTSGSNILPGGTNWNAYSCPTCTGATPIWPTEPFCIDPLTLANGQTQPCTYQCSIQHGACFSSHEVANFWPDANTGNWYAVHLMYWVDVGQGVDATEIDQGCLVVSTANSPSGLGWSANQGPASCGDAFPNTSNAALPWSNLDNAVAAANNGVQPTCDSWGEPAIMVAAAPAGVTGDAYGNVVYLAANCLKVQDNNYLVSYGYYFFYNQTSTFLTPTDWVNLSGPFLPGSGIPFAYPPSTPPPADGSQLVNSVTEFDWAQRADNSLVAVLTEAYVPDGQHSGVAMQYGCVALDFDVQNTGNPFGGVLATLTDLDGAAGSPTWEQQGPSGCTYEPAANTGIVIVRHLVNSSDASQYQLYSILDTGIFP